MKRFATASLTLVNNHLKDIVEMFPFVRIRTCVITVIHVILSNKVCRKVRDDTWFLPWKTLGIIQALKILVPQRAGLPVAGALFQKNALHRCCMSDNPF